MEVGRHPSSEQTHSSQAHIPRLGGQTDASKEPSRVRGHIPGKLESGCGTHLGKQGAPPRVPQYMPGELGCPR